VRKKCGKGGGAPSVSSAVEDRADNVAPRSLATAPDSQVDGMSKPANHPRDVRDGGFAVALSGNGVVVGHAQCLARLQLEQLLAEGGRLAPPGSLDTHLLRVCRLDRHKFDC